MDNLLVMLANPFLGFLKLIENPCIPRNYASLLQVFMESVLTGSWFCFFLYLASSFWNLPYKETETKSGVIYMKSDLMKLVLKNHPVLSNHALYYLQYNCSNGFITIVIVAMSWGCQLHSCQMIKYWIFVLHKY